ncbi:uncharacterized protein C22orf42 isoform X2 [Homo sapiens]|nr:uncharacterized protein C22orf42 isoform X2 [Homo sapiens]|eukprot:XP_016884118.1 uncharacterized protein C22orf42 isoform X2 [Homo sapiens]
MQSPQRDRVATRCPMGSKLTCCLGPSGGLNCDCCRPDVGPCHECEIPETVAATAPASTTAKPAKLDLKAKKAQLMQYLSLPKTPKMLKMSKGLDARSKRWLKIIWRRHGIWPLENIGPTEDVQASAHGGVEENMTSDIEIPEAKHDHRPTEDVQVSAHGGVEENITSDIEISEAKHDHHLVEDLSESLSVCLEDFMTSDLSESLSVSLEDFMTSGLSESLSVSLEDLMTPEMAKERYEDYLCWVKMARSRLNEPISSQVLGLLRL